MENSKNFILSEDTNDKEVAIKLDNVTFGYFNSEHETFQGLNLSIPKNKHTIVTGPNGSGKSTFLGLISGVLYPTLGSITTTSEKYGYVGANPLILNDSIRENLIYGNTKEISDKKLMEYLKLFKTFEKDEDYNLDKLISNKTLSSGQMQKIAYIRTLIYGVDILILDESTSNLDSESKKVIYEIIDNLEITIINSTHNPDELHSYDMHIKMDELANNEILKNE